MIFKCSYCKKDFANIKDCEGCEANCKKLFDEQATKENQKKEDFAKIEKARNEYTRLIIEYSNKYKCQLFFHSSAAQKEVIETFNKIFNEAFNLL